MKLISSNTRRNPTSASSSSSLSFTFLLSLLLTFLPSLTSAIKFELTSVSHPTTKCIWNYALADTLVVVTVNAIPTSGDGDVQNVDVEIVDGSKHNNIYLSKRGVTGETRMAINTHAHADLGVCFKNTLGKIPSGHSVAPTYVTTIDLDVDIGADAVDYNAIANQESLSGLETEMRKLEGVVGEIVNEMEYLKKREIKMKDTNDSTNARVQNFAWLTIIALIGLGVWQIFHLRGFFKRKYLID